MTSAAETTSRMDQGRRPSIQLDSSYVKALPGILKIVKLVVNLIAFICVLTTYQQQKKIYRNPLILPDESDEVQPVQPSYYRHNSSFGWYSFVSMGAFCGTLIILLLHLLYIMKWFLVEFGFCILWAMFYFIAAIVASVNAPMDDSWGAAAFFGFVAMVLYGFDAFVTFKVGRNRGIVQGERAIVAATTTTIPSNPILTHEPDEFSCVVHTKLPRAMKL